MNQDAVTDTRPRRRPEARFLARGPRATTSTGCASAGRPVGSHGRPARQRISVRAFSPTKASRPSPSTVPSQTSSPSSRSSAAASDGRIADEADLGDAEQLGRRERAGRARLADPAMRDQLDDAAGRVVEVDRRRVPVREVEHGLARLRVGEELDAVTRPRERRVEAVARDEEREVVERRARRRRELEHGLPDLDRQPAVVAAAQSATRRAGAVERRRAPAEGSPGPRDGRC